MESLVRKLACLALAGSLTIIRKVSRSLRGSDASDAHAWLGWAGLWLCRSGAFRGLL